MLHKMLWVEKAYQMDAARHARKPIGQVFVTQSHVLAKNVENIFQTYLASIVSCPTTSEKPELFSELEDRHFPLFITVDLFSSRWMTTRSTGTAIFNVRSRYQFINFETQSLASEDLSYRYCPLPMGLGEESSLPTTDSWESIGHTSINLRRGAYVR